MATVYSDINGEILTFCDQWDTEKKYPNVPQGTVSTLKFDEITNQTLVLDIMLSTAPYVLKGSTLSKNGNPITINPPSPIRLDVENFKDNIIPKLYNADTLNQEDLKCAIRVILKQIGEIKPY